MPPDVEQMKTWLLTRKAAEEVDLGAWREQRDILDEQVRADTRTLVRQVLIPVINATTVEDAHRLAEGALAILAAPGPADSAAKRLHTRTRQATAEAEQTLIRHLNRTTEFLGEF